MKNKIKKPWLTDGAPKDFVGNHHLWFIKAYRKWTESKQSPNRMASPYSNNDSLKP